MTQLIDPWGRHLLMPDISNVHCKDVVLVAWWQVTSSTVDGDALLLED